MQLLNLLGAAPALLAALSLTAATPVPSLEARQAAYSTTWRDTCAYRPAQNFKAFNVGACQAQLTFARDQRMLTTTWGFDAIYPDGSRVRQAPLRDFNRLAVSDPDYTTTGGLNWDLAWQNRTFTSVHEFTNICKNGIAPTSWTFVVTRPSTTTCARNNYFNSVPITAVSGVRPAQPRITSGTRINAQGDYDLRWGAVSGAVAYAVTLKTYTSGAGETPYYTTLRGKRSTTNSAILDTGVREAGRPRFFAVNAVNNQGVWSYTPDVNDYSAAW